MLKKLRSDLFSWGRRSFELPPKPFPIPVDFPNRLLGAAADSLAVLNLDTVGGLGEISHRRRTFRATRRAFPGDPELPGLEVRP